MRTTIPLLLLLLLCGGCFFRSTPETKYYDLAPERIGEGAGTYPVVLHEFRNLSGAGTRLLFRRGIQVTFDPAAKWILPPEQLLPRALGDAIPPQSKPYRVEGTIERFETDTETRRFLLAGTFSVNGAPTQRFTFREILHGEPSPAIVADAASRAANELAGVILTSLRAKP